MYQCNLSNLVWKKVIPTLQSSHVRRCGAFNVNYVEYLLQIFQKNTLPSPRLLSLIFSTSVLIVVPSDGFCRCSSRITNTSFLFQDRISASPSRPLVLHSLEATLVQLKMVNKYQGESLAFYSFPVECLQLHIWWENNPLVCISHHIHKIECAQPILTMCSYLWPRAPLLSDYVVCPGCRGRVVIASSLVII